MILSDVCFFLVYVTRSVQEDLINFDVKGGIELVCWICIDGFAELSVLSYDYKKQLS